MSLQWTTCEILRARKTREPQRFNPRPCGVFLQGSTTDCVLRWLESGPRRAWWTRSQIVSATGRNRGAVEWALIFLMRTGRLECTGRDQKVQTKQHFRLVRA